MLVNASIAQARTSFIETTVRAPASYSDSRAMGTRRDRCPSFGMCPHPSRNGVRRHSEYALSIDDAGDESWSVDVTGLLFAWPCAASLHVTRCDRDRWGQVPKEMHIPTKWRSGSLERFRRHHMRFQLLCSRKIFGCGEHYLRRGYGTRCSDTYQA